ncbi:MAG: hypothetical protein CMA30_07485 [Euryarchaeota archaeon]|nr:hypothetical protein [Euryarchaeota archaeon]|tara:strand:- start:1509 stop:2066 length:558 start_codon:yes stop_codon:yes gene_type:complete
MIEIPNLEQLGITQNQWFDVCELAKRRDVESPVLLEVQRNASSLGRWDIVYSLSLLAGLETSVLIDSEDNVSIDWGDPGRVILKAPHGFMAPFKLWVHTHPGFMAYWSSTDTNSLALGSMIIETALVLGAPGIKRTRNSTFCTFEEDSERISQSGPLNQWTDEEIVNWKQWYISLEKNTLMEKIV